MLEIDIPGYKHLRLQHLVLDFNGTLGCDGRLLEGVKEALGALSPRLTIHILTADTFGTVRQEFNDLACMVSVIHAGNEDEAKLRYLERLGSEKSICIGNGCNDKLMLKHAAVGIAVVGREGAAAEALMAADIIVVGILNALGLLLSPRRLLATLRS